MGRKKKEQPFLYCADVMKLLECGKTKAHDIIRALNEELAAKGYIVMRGRVSRKYFFEKYYA